MIAATCPACNAQFEVDFAPGTEFTCGACEAIVTTPAAPPRVAPKGAPGGPPTGRPAAPGPRAPRPNRSAAPPRRSAADRGHAVAGKKPTGLIVGGALGAVALIVILVVALSSNDGDGEGGATPAGGGGGSEPASGKVAATQQDTLPKDPYERARHQARSSGAGLADMVAFAEMAWTMAQDADGEEARKKYERDYESTYRRILQVDENHATARRRLGYVAFSVPEAEGWLKLPNLPPSLHGEIEFAVEDAKDAGGGKAESGRTWLSTQKDRGREWAIVRKAVEDHLKLEADRKTDPFYRKAESVGQQLADELSDPQRMGGSKLLRKGVEGSAFAVYTRYKPYVLLVQKDPTIDVDKEAERWGSILEDLNSSFWRKYATKLGIREMDRLTPIIVLYDREDYAKYLRRNDKFAPITSGAHFEPWSNRLVCYRDSHERDRSVLFHEGTHQLVDYCMQSAPRNAGQRQSFWFSEGLAEYFAGHGRTWNADSGNWNYNPGKVYVDKIDLLVSASDRGELMPLEELCEYSRAKSNADRADPTRSRRYSIAYAQGWAMVYFLNNWNDRKYAAKFLDYLKEEFAGRSGFSAFKRAFGDDIPGMEKEFAAMVKELEAAKKEGRILNGELVPKKG